MYTFAINILTVKVFFLLAISLYSKVCVLGCNYGLQARELLN